MKGIEMDLWLRCGLVWMLMTTLPGFSKTIYPLIPQPVDLQPQEGYFEITPQTVITVDPSAEGLGNTLADMLAPAIGNRLPVSQHQGENGTRIVLTLNETLNHGETEGYRLRVRPNKVTIEAAAHPGLFYGCMTLLQLLPPEIYSDVKAESIQWKIPCVEINDSPRFQWRGMHLDVCRHFMPVEFVKKYIDLIAMHKMNIFHWHLTEDQGWRIEIKKYPKLTEVSAWRKETVVGRGRTKPLEFDGTPHGGFYTQDEIREIVAYARKRFVTIVPEIEMPGHCQAAIAAYPELGNNDQPLDVCRWWGYGEDVFNVEDSTISFLQDILTEVMDLFPGQFIHIGGDEVPKHHWKNSPAAQVRIKELGLSDEEQLQSWFIKQMDAFLIQRGRRLVGWDEILEGGLAPGATVMSWRGTEGGIAAAIAGHDVVMAPASHTYFDHYQAGPIGEPLAIGGFTPLQKVYAFEPVPDTLTDQQVKHILGAQGQVWTEFILDPDHVEYMALPRMCALAEVVWTRTDEKDYDAFYERLKIHARRLKMFDVNFHPLIKDAQKAKQPAQ
jgi:hexosaminidase